MKKNQKPHNKNSSKSSRSAKYSTVSSSSPVKAVKSLSQNFLTDSLLLEKMAEIVSEATPTPTRLLEVGPGTGALTKRICALENVTEIIAIEKDPRSVDYLKETLCLSYPKLQVHLGDILHMDQGVTSTAQPMVCVGNLPYSISSEFLLWFCKNKSAFSSGHFLLQKEVVHRVAAVPGTKSYEELTAIVGLHFFVQVHFDVPPEAFEPRPKVTSTYMSLSPKPFEFDSEELKVIFERCTAFLFSARRKMMRKTLEHLFSSMEIPYADHQSKVTGLLNQHGIEMTDRPERLSPLCFLELARFLYGAQRAQDDGPKFQQGSERK